MFPRLMMLWFLITVVACGSGSPPASTVRRVVITPGTFLLTTAGQTRQLTAVAYDAQGQPVQTPLSWSSTAAAQLSVDAGGQVTAHSLGSAQIVAEAGGVRSAPAFAVVAQPRPGALLVTDAEVLRIGPPLNRPAGVYPGVGTRYEVNLSGVSDVPVGTAVLAAETAAVAGKVVSSRVEGASLVVLLEQVPLPALFDRYHLDWTIDLSPYDI
ncbi:hypothetical protein [Deinococcus sp.]|uniref:Ig-like domain-containing protein n=1 Tax=Deinococcus sp. TaxID=47478 RepID=UPI002869BC16|nr:hypothetical protein [Deinococcus sp.]